MAMHKMATLPRIGAGGASWFRVDPNQLAEARGRLTSGQRQARPRTGSAPEIRTRELSETPSFSEFPVLSESSETSTDSLFISAESSDEEVQHF